MHDNKLRQTSIRSAAAKAGALYGSEVAAERSLRRQAVRALDKVENFLKTGFLSIEEIENKLDVKLNTAPSAQRTKSNDDRGCD